MSISLPPDVEEFVSQEIQHGSYATADELLRDAVQLLRARQLEAVKLKGSVENL